MENEDDSSCEDFFHDVAMNVGETKIAPAVTVGQSFVVQSQQVQHGGMHRPEAAARRVSADSGGKQACGSQISALASISQKARPNPSFNATANGVPTGPRGSQYYHLLRGPGGTPSTAR